MILIETASVRRPENGAYASELIRLGFTHDDDDDDEPLYMAHTHTGGLAKNCYEDLKLYLMSWHKRLANKKNECNNCLYIQPRFLILTRNLNNEINVLLNIYFFFIDFFFYQFIATIATRLQLGI